MISGFFLLPVLLSYVPHTVAVSTGLFSVSNFSAVQTVLKFLQMPLQHVYTIEKQLSLLLPETNANPGRFPGAAALRYT